MQTTIRAATAADAAAMAAIYAPYVLETCISFEEAAPDAAEMAARIAKTGDAGLPWLVLEADGVVAGYAYASKWRERPAYRFAVESSVYLAREALGRGYGKALYATLIAALRAQGYHCVIGGIAQPNPASVRLHEAMGFVPVAMFKEVGFKAGAWRDVGYWQLTLRDSASPE